MEGKGIITAQRFVRRAPFRHGFAVPHIPWGEFYMFKAAMKFHGRLICV